jgi:hypothetical protein
MPSVNSFKASLDAFGPIRVAAVGINPSKQFEQSADVAAGQAMVQRAVYSKSRKDFRRDFGDMVEV